MYNKLFFTNISSRLLVLLVLMIIKTRADSTACEEKEKHLALLELAKECFLKAKDLQPALGNDLMDIASNSIECDAKAKVSAYVDIARNLIEVAKDKYSLCGKDQYAMLHEKPADCSEILENGHNESGIYTIWPRHSIFSVKPLEVYCDMDTDGGGWTVIQRRGNFSNKVDFYRDWRDYSKGFGNISEEFWIGNDKIYVLTNQANYTLRFDLENVRKERRYASYSSFWVEGEFAGYRLHYGNHEGTVGDGMEKSQNMQFSTKDKINEISRNKCTSWYESGWWFSSGDRCTICNPNGLNQPGVWDTKSMYWGYWTQHESLLTIEMKIRPEK